MRLNALVSSHAHQPSLSQEVRMAAIPDILEFLQRYPPFADLDPLHWNCWRRLWTSNITGPDRSSSPREDPVEFLR